MRAHKKNYVEKKMHSKITYESLFNNGLGFFFKCFHYTRLKKVFSLVSHLQSSHKNLRLDL